METSSRMSAHRWLRAGRGGLSFASARAKLVAPLVGILASLVLVGCGSSETDAASSTTASGSPHSGTRPPASKAADMVAAVSAKPGAGLVDLRFAITQRPKVGEPVDIELALTPSVELEQLFARFQVAEGLQLVSGGETEHIEHAPAHVAVGHKITVIAKTDGIFYVTAVVLADSDKDSVARNFNIPIIAGQGLAELPPAPAAASVADSQRAPARP